MNNQNNQFDKDERMVKIKTILVILFLLAVSFLTCHKAISQSTEVRQILVNMDDISSSSWKYPNGGNIFTEDGQRVGSDTTPVIFVLVKESYYEEMSGDTFHLIPYPSLETIYGYHVQNWKPYSVVFYDIQWNVIEEEPLYIKRRKLFKK